MTEELNQQRRTNGICTDCEERVWINEDGRGTCCHGRTITDEYIIENLRASLAVAVAALEYVVVSYGKPSLSGSVMITAIDALQSTMEDEVIRLARTI